MSYGATWRNIRRSLTWIRRRRQPDGTRSVERHAIPRPTVGRARRVRPPKNPLWILVPPLVVAFLGVIHLQMYRPGIREAGVYAFFVLSILFLINAATSRVAPPVKLVGIAWSAIYPVWAFIALCF